MNDVNDDLILVFIAFYFLLRMNNLLLFLMTLLISIWLYGFFLMLSCLDNIHFGLCMTLLDNLVCMD
jgi:hypothetical protein